VAKKEAFTQKIKYIATYFSTQMTADDTSLGVSAKMSQGNTLPATKGILLLIV
jgi:hypothetical protein